MEWREDIINRFFRSHDAERFLKIRLPTRVQEDFIAWAYEKNGCFSVRSAYRLAKSLLDEERGGSRQSNSTDGEVRPIWKTFWKIPLPHKVLIFGWKLINDGLATRVNKRRRSIEQGSPSPVTRIVSVALNSMSCK